MMDSRVSALINLLRLKNDITPLQKDILDTAEVLERNPFDFNAAHKQMVSNNTKHPEILRALIATPGVVQKTAETLTSDDVVFTLRYQLTGLVATETEAQLNGNHQ